MQGGRAGGLDGKGVVWFGAGEKQGERGISPEEVDGEDAGCWGKTNQEGTMRDVGARQTKREQRL